MPSTSVFRELTPYFVYLLLTATLGPLLFGYHLAELNVPQAVITCAEKSGRTTNDVLPQCISMNPTQFGLVSSFFTLGGLIGALSAGPLTAKQGRLRTMVYSAGFAAVGPVFEAVAPSVPVLAIGRLLSGVGAGSATVVVPIYVSEISPPDKRGLFGACTQILTNLGILITQVFGLFLSRGQLWRIILGVGGFIGLLQILGLILGGSESPQWLAANGKTSKGKNILRKIRGQRSNIEEEVSKWGAGTGHGVDEEEETLLTGEPQPSDVVSEGQIEGVSSRKRGDGTSKQIGAFGVLRHPEYAPAVMAIMMIMVAQQFTGINSVVMYGVGLLSNLLGANSALLNVAVAVVNVVVTTSCAPLPDRWGRKICLLLSIAGMGISSLLLAVGIIHSVRILSAVAVVFFVASFGFGLGPIPFILAAELVNTEAVGATQSWALAANWTATFIVAQFFPLINERMGKGQVYFIFAGFAAAFGVFVAWYVPETKGKKDADEVWGRRKAPDLED